MEIDRRRFLAALGAGITLGSQSALGEAVDRPVYLTAARDGKIYRAVLLDDDGKVRWSLELPGRGHGGAFRPSSRECVIFARRPGQFAMVLDRTTGALSRTLVPPEGRRFYGHGCYSSDGRRLYTTENDYAEHRGVVGVWDASDGYRRVGEFDSHGIGPHEMILMPDGQTLAVANGGIATHPDTGRRKLNIPEMEPSLVFLNGRDGSLEVQLTAPRELHKLSLRHLSANRQGTLFAAAQFEGAPDETPPLLASVQSGKLKFHEAPLGVQMAMRNYCGSVSFDATGRVLAVSCPRGNLVTYWNAEGEFVASNALNDGCGLAPYNTAGEFIATSGAGAITRSTPTTAKTLDRAAFDGVKWDNHVVARLSD